MHPTNVPSVPAASTHRLVRMVNAAQTYPMEAATKMHTAAARLRRMKDLFCNYGKQFVVLLLLLLPAHLQPLEFGCVARDCDALSATATNSNQTRLD